MGRWYRQFGAGEVYITFGWMDGWMDVGVGGWWRVDRLGWSVVGLRVMVDGCVEASAQL